MAIYFLTNNLAADSDQADQIVDGYTVAGLPGNGVKTEYDKTLICTGSRGELVQFDSHVAGENNSIAYFNSSGDLTADYIAITRADLLIRDSNLFFALSNSTNSDPTTGWGTVFTDTMDSNDMIGIDKFNLGYGQDYVNLLGSSETSKTGLGFVTANLTASPESTIFSDLFIGTKFQFGSDKNPIASGTSIQEFESVDINGSPIRGDLVLELEARFNLLIERVSTTKLNEFKNLPKVFQWPLLIYDEDADLFPWKLEHVIIEGFSANLVAPDKWDLNLLCGRLRHYE